jgi:predicted permease
MSANSFSLIRQKPVVGRDFSPSDEKPDAPAVVILGYSIWQNRYAGNAGVIGRTIRVDEIPAVVIGVMPEGFRFPVNADLWLPLVPSGRLENRDVRNLGVFGRLADHAGPASARAEMNLLSQRLEKEHAKTNRGVRAVVKPYNDEFNGGIIRVVFLALLGAVGFVLLIACANVANLLLSRSISRAREVSIRTALGASRWRLVRQLLVESLLLSLLGGLAGLLLSIWGVRMFRLAVANVGKPYWIDFSMDFTVFAYLAAVCLGTAILFGLAPALHASRVDLNENLKESARATSGGRRARNLSGSLVVSELALSVVLLAAAGLMIRSFINLYGMHSGLDASRILTMRLSLAELKYPEPKDLVAFHDRLQPRLSAIPGVEAAAFTSNLPMGGAFGWRFELEGDPQVEPEKRPSVSGLVVGPGYFRALGLSLVRGRAFDNSDGLPGREVAVVNQRFAARYWPGEDPVGKRLRLIKSSPQPWLTIVGVCPDVLQTEPTRAEVQPSVYVPYRQDPVRFLAIAARTRLDPNSLAAAFRNEVRHVDDALPVFSIRPLTGYFEQQRWGLRTFGTLFAIFAGIALVLASLGIYAVMAYSVGQRTQEIGLRMALGASSPSILGMVLAAGLKRLLLGLALGLAAAFGLTRVIAGLLVRVNPADPLTFAGISLLLAAVGVFACWLPARRAMRVDPAVALRHE